jgi:opacity protein-like surface antigen
MKLAICLVFPLTLLVSSVYAEDEWQHNVYVGGKIGRSHVNFDLSSGGIGKVEDEQERKVSIDRKDAIFDAVIGYKFNAYIAAELGYLDLGDYTAKAGSYGKGTASASGATISALWSFPFDEKFSVYARTGVLFAKTRTKARYTNSDDEFVSERENRSDVVPVLGIGANYNLTKNWQLTGEYRDVGSATLVKAAGESLDIEVNAFTVGANYFF